MNMHKYILKVTRYSEAGALTTETQFITADTPQALSDLKAKWDKMRYQTVAEDGTVTVGNKMYRTEVMQGVYETIADWDNFCTVNAVLR